MMMVPVMIDYNFSECLLLDDSIHGGVMIEMMMMMMVVMILVVMMFMIMVMKEMMMVFPSKNIGAQCNWRIQ